MVTEMNRHFRGFIIATIACLLVSQRPVYARQYVEPVRNCRPHSASRNRPTCMTRTVVGPRRLMQHLDTNKNISA
jgi:hypothetical protein